jgi:hypothetical protein
MMKTAVEAVGGLMVAALLSGSAPARLSAQDTLPTGFGSLKRDDIVVNFSTGALQIQFLPLDEQVIRLLAPDTYASLRQLIKQKSAEIDDQATRAGVTNPSLVMVTFFAVVPQARFTPEAVNVTSRGRLFRPVGIVPLSPTWGGQQLDARQQAAAIYIFESGIAFQETLTVSYESMTNDSWSRALQRLNQERARVLSRAQSQSPSH